MNRCSKKVENFPFPRFVGSNILSKSDRQLQTNTLRRHSVSRHTHISYIKVEIGFRICMIEKSYAKPQNKTIFQELDKNLAYCLYNVKGLGYRNNHIQTKVPVCILVCA